MQDSVLNFVEAVMLVACSRRMLLCVEMYTMILSNLN